MSGQAENLQQLVGFFKVDAGDGHGAVRVQQARRAAAQAPKAAPGHLHVHAAAQAAAPATKEFVKF